MNKDFIPYEQALALKNLGFDADDYFGFWNLIEYDTEWTFDIRINMDSVDYIEAPLFQQAFRWFREEHNLRGFIGFRPNTKQYDCHVYDMSLSGKEYVKQRTMEEYNKDTLVGTYEEAELACLIKLIEIVKQKQ